jgi:aryl-alcohol dehydrogenase-like predicted oxidoreductase
VRIDAHHHVWDLAAREQPWTTDIPLLRRTFTADELRPALRTHRIDATVARACERQGVVLPHAAMRFPLRHPALAPVVAGVRSPAQAESAAWATTDLPEDAWRAIRATTAITAITEGSAEWDPTRSPS